MTMPMRDDKGRYVPGHPGDPTSGRKPKPTEQEYYDALREAVPIERFKLIVEKQLQRAERGEILAFNAIVNRLVPERRDLTIEHSGSLNILGLEDMLARVYGDEQPQESGQDE